jgi:ribonuclease BN (tRNA processing enzyme)
MTPRVWVRLLGTGGAANEGRHQACLLVGAGDSMDEGLILLDTGGGLDVVRQLVATGYSPTAVRDIFVSHQHLDHSGGLEPLLLWSVIRSLRGRGGPPKEETRVYCESRVLSVIERLFDAVGTAAPRLFGGKLRLTPMMDGEAVELRSGARLTTFLVDHLPVDGGAMGCRLELGRVRVVYSGDTRPTPRLVQFAQEADLLIHETGGLDAQGAEVHRLGHSTAGDAGRAAKAAGVGRLVLTHVPGEALAAPMLAEARAAFGGPVELAHDLALLELR